MLLIRLAFSCVEVDGFGRLLAAVVPKLFSNWWGEPLSWHKLFRHGWRSWAVRPAEWVRRPFMVRPEVMYVA